MSDEEEFDFLLPSGGTVDPKYGLQQDPVGDTILKDWDVLSKQNLVKPPTNKDRKWVRSRTNNHRNRR